MNVTEGNERRGGLLPPPATPKPTIRPAGQMERLKLFGLPVELDDTMPKDEIHIRSGNQVVKIKVTK